MMRVATGYTDVTGRATFQAKVLFWPIGRKNCASDDSFGAVCDDSFGAVCTV